MLFPEKVQSSIDGSKYISRDLSWIKFNYRVLDQAYHEDRTVLERLKFLAITASNLDEFFMIRVGSLYNYIDYNKHRIDYSGLREGPFRIRLFEELQAFVDQQQECFNDILKPLFKQNHFQIGNLTDLTVQERKGADAYFKKTVFPMLTPMLTDAYRTFPLLMNKLLIFGIVTIETEDQPKEERKLSFVQIPQNLPRFYEVVREDEIIFIPIEELIRENIHLLYRNVEIVSVNLFRITRNGDYTLDESEDVEAKFLDELKRKLKSRRTGRVVRLELEPGCSKWMLKKLKNRWDIDEYNIFKSETLIDFTSLWQIIKHEAFEYYLPDMPSPVPPISVSILDEEANTESIFQLLKKKDIFIHHPFNSIDILLEMLEAAAEDPNVLAIKMTIYRLAKNSRITAALLRAAENGKHVSALFEVKARFDEENNMNEAKRLEAAGCFVIYGVSSLKTHTKMLLVVRKEKEKITRYVHMGSGNYNEGTSNLYTDIGLLSSRNEYAQDVSEFFNAITGHSKPKQYDYLLTAPINMRSQLIALIKQEAKNAKAGKPSGISVKINSLQDDKFIDALYEASQAGVPIKLIIRGICCIRPKRKGLSENIEVYSLVGDFLEHSRIYYFHNAGTPKVFGGSADVMVRSFDRRIESLFEFIDEQARQEAINILAYNLKDNQNAYEMQEDGSYKKRKEKGEPSFNTHLEFFKVKNEDLPQAKLFD